MLSETEKESSIAPGYVLGCKDEKLPLANPRRAEQVRLNHKRMR